jgi:hypothetical protein
VRKKRSGEESKAHASVEKEVARAGEQMKCLWERRKRPKGKPLHARGVVDG